MKRALCGLLMAACGGGKPQRVAPQDAAIAPVVDAAAAVTLPVWEAPSTGMSSLYRVWFDGGVVRAIGRQVAFERTPLGKWKSIPFASVTPPEPTKCDVRPARTGGTACARNGDEVWFIGETGSFNTTSSETTLYRSRDGGATWTTTPMRTGKRALFLSSLAIAPGGKVAFAVGGTHVLRTDDGGATWSRDDDTLEAALVGLVMTPGGPIAVGDALARRDAAGVWREEPLRGIGMVMAATWSADGTLWLAGAHDYPGGGLFGEGRSLGRYFPNGVYELVRDVETKGGGFDAIHRYDAVAVGSDGAIWATGEMNVIEKSVDNGKTWRPVRNTPRCPLVWAADADHAICAGQHGVHVTRDGGQSWKNHPLTPDKSDPWIEDLAVTDATNVWVVGKQTIASSRDGGTTWTRHPLPPGEEHPLAVWTGGPDDVWVGAMYGALFHSVDGGATWEKVPAGVRERIDDITGDAGAVWVLSPDGIVRVR